MTSLAWELYAINIPQKRAVKIEKIILPETLCGILMDMTWSYDSHEFVRIILKCRFFLCFWNRRSAGRRTFAWACDSPSMPGKTVQASLWRPAQDRYRVRPFRFRSSGDD